MFLRNVSVVIIKPPRPRFLLQFPCRAGCCISQFLVFPFSRFLCYAVNFFHSNFLRYSGKFKEGKISSSLVVVTAQSKCFLPPRPQTGLREFHFPALRGKSILCFCFCICLGMIHVPNKAPVFRPRAGFPRTAYFAASRGEAQFFFLLGYCVSVLCGKPQYKLFSYSCFPRRAGKSTERMMNTSLVYRRDSIKTILVGASHQKAKKLDSEHVG